MQASERDARATEEPAWFQSTYPQAPLGCIAYFSMEFMLSEALPIYSGGLGNVAGEWLRLTIELPGQLLRVRTWRVQTGRTSLCLLGSNDAANLPALPK